MWIAWHVGACMFKNTCLCTVFDCDCVSVDDGGGGVCVFKHMTMYSIRLCMCGWWGVWVSVSLNT